MKHGVAESTDGIDALAGRSKSAAAATSESAFEIITTAAADIIEYKTADIDDIRAAAAEAKFQRRVPDAVDRRRRPAALVVNDDRSRSGTTRRRRPRQGRVAPIDDGRMCRRDAIVRTAGVVERRASIRQHAPAKRRRRPVVSSRSSHHDEQLHGHRLIDRLHAADRK